MMEFLFMKEFLFRICKKENVEYANRNILFKEKAGC